MKSKLMALFTAIFMVVGLFSIIPMPVLAADTNYWTDSGNYSIAWYTGASPYTISTAEELAGLAVLNNGLNGVTRVSFIGKTIILAQDIDVSAHLWTPIGTDAFRFGGTFDGNGKTITGISINTTLDSQGLFGCVGNGTIKNVGMVGGSITGREQVGSIAGSIIGTGATVTNCYNTGVVNGTNNVGGVVGGSSWGDAVTNCYNTGAVDGTFMVGGVVGSSTYSCTVTNCYNTGAVSGTTSSIGGVVGLINDSSSVKNCYNTGAVSGTGNVGGVVGWNDSGTVVNTYYVGFNFGIGGGTGSLTGTTPFTKILPNPVGVGKYTTVTEQKTSDFNAAWKSAFGSDFAVSYADYSSSDTSKATCATVSSEKRINGIAVGNSTITGTLTITQNGLTSTGFNGATNVITVPVSMPLSVTSGGGGTAIPTYAITVGTLTHGSIIATPNTAASGDTITLTVNPASGGYRLKAGTLKYNGTEITQTAGVYCFTMPAGAVTITAEFELIPATTYAIAVGALTHGSITANPITAASGDTISLTVTPDSGYRLKSGTLKYNGTAVIGTSFAMPAEAVTVTAEFELIPSAAPNPPSSFDSSSSSSASNSKTITVIETPAGIDNPQLIGITASDNAFDESVEVRLKDDGSARVAIEQALTQQFADITEDLTIFPLDISLYIKGTNTKVQPKAGSSVEITCPIPSELLANKDNIKIACVIDGKLQILPTKVVLKNGVYCVVFTASHFSPYAFAVDKDGKLSNLAAGAPISDNAAPIYTNGLPYMAIIIGLAVLGIVYKRRKKIK